MSTLKNHQLFNEFPPVSTEEWEEKIRQDLKGADYEKKLVWQTLENIRVQPYYRKEHLADKEYLTPLPGEFPYVRGNKAGSYHWEIRQDIKLDDIETAHQKSQFYLDHGVTSLGYIFPSAGEKPLLKNLAEFSRLLRDIPLDRIGFNFICGYNAPKIVNMLQAEVEFRKFDKARIRGSVDFDPLGYLTITGKFYTSEDADFEILTHLLQFVSSHLPNYHALAINGCYFHSAGSSIVQELGYSLALANDYLSRLTDSGLTVDTVCHHLQFNLGIGSNYFMEIARLRAARFLWANIMEAYHPEKEGSKKMYIHSITSDWNQTLFDPYMNVLRGTTESMSAVIGGTDSLLVRPFTDPYKPITNFSDRLARNIQIILNEEAYLGKVADPGAGSYYIENLTDSIIEEAWKIFLKVEAEGGYLQALKKGIVQTDIEKTAQHRYHLIATQREVMVGTNQYPDFNESVKHEIDEEIAFPVTPIGDAIIVPLKKYRYSMEFEKLRLATEKHTHRPKVFILTFGDLSMRRARATFSCNFFACAGYEVIDNPGFSSVKEGAKAAHKVKADMVVLCSSDDEYATLTSEDLTQLRDNAILVVTGAPKCMDELKAKGIENYIHFRSNILETLTYYHQILGISV